jgi:hypothetical protein
MCRVSDASGSFAHVLRHAVERRGLALERIRDHLAARGVCVSVATLSYWQSGRSQPGRKASLAAIPHLEEVLGLDPDALLRTVPVTRDRARRTPVRELDVLWPEPSRKGILGRLDTRWDADLDRVTLHDVLRIGADRRQAGLTVRQVMRARVDGPDRRVVMHSQDDTTVSLPAIRVVQGCELGRVEWSHEDGVVGAELVFFRPLRRGETVVVEYDLVSPVPGAADSEYVRRLRSPMREYLLEVEFHPDALPSSVVGFTEERRTSIELDPCHRGHLAHTDATPGTTGIRWTWDDDGPPDARAS